MTSVQVVGKSLGFEVPFSKVDKEKRMVHGFATVDNRDLEGDIVEYQASVKAFREFRGNIREMHNNHKAVGKMLEFRPEELYDIKSGQIHKGIFVSAYVSKGAESTWQKVVDGTLSGFSIKAIINKASQVFDDAAQELTRIISDYDIIELSLVDSPMNTLANVVSIEKGVASGYLAETETENVFYCSKHNVLQITDGDSATCHKCGAEMINMGFVEAGDENKTEVLKSLVDNIKNAPQVGDVVDFPEGIGRVESVFSKGEVTIPGIEKSYIATENSPLAVVRIGVKNNGTIVDTDGKIIKSLSNTARMEVDEVDVVSTETEVIETTVEETEDVVEDSVEESTEEEVVVEKSTDEPSITIDDVLEAVKSLAGLLETLPSAIEKGFQGITDAFSEVNEKAENAEKALEEAKITEKALSEQLNKRLEAVESATARRKSGDVGTQVVGNSTPEKEESSWGGFFTPGI